MNKRDILDMIELNKITLNYIDQTKFVLLKKIENASYLIDRSFHKINQMSQLVKTPVEKKRKSSSVYFAIPTILSNEAFFSDTFLNNLSERIEQNDIVYYFQIGPNNHSYERLRKTIITKKASLFKIYWDDDNDEIGNNNESRNTEDIFTDFLNNSGEMVGFIIKEASKTIDLESGRIFICKSMMSSTSIFISFWGVQDNLEEDKEYPDLDDYDLASPQVLAHMPRAEIIYEIAILKWKILVSEAIKEILLLKILDFEQRHDKQEIELKKNQFLLRNFKFELELEEQQIINDDEGDLWG